MTNFFTAGSFKLFRTDYPAEHRMGPHQDCTPKISIVTRGELCETIAGREEFASSGSVVVKPEGVTHADLLGPNGAEVLSLTLPAWPSDPAWRECRWFHGGPATVAATRLVVVLREKHVSPAEIDDIVYDLVASVEPGPQAKGSLDEISFFEMMLEESKPMTTEFAYSNLGYNMIGYVLGAVTGKPWQEVVTETVLRPVGMTHTTTSIEAAAQGNFALPYAMKADKYESVPMKSDDTMHSAGGIVTTSSDLARWLIVNLNEGRIEGRTVLEPDAVRAAHESYATTDREFYRFQRNGYGLGWYHSDFEGELLMHHFGGFRGYHAHTSFMPEHDIGVAVVINTSDYSTGTITHMIAAYAYELLLDHADVETEYAAELKKNAARTTARKQFDDGVNAGMELVMSGNPAPGAEMILSALKGGRHAGIVGEDTINRLGYALLKEMQVDPAIAIFEYNVEANPGSPNVYDSLGEAYETAGRLDLAKASYHKAWEIATTRGDRNAELFKKNLDRVSAVLN